MILAIYGSCSGQNDQEAFLATALEKLNLFHYYRVVLDGFSTESPKEYEREAAMAKTRQK